MQPERLDWRLSVAAPSCGCSAEWQPASPHPPKCQIEDGPSHARTEEVCPGRHDPCPGDCGLVAGCRRRDLGRAGVSVACGRRMFRRGHGDDRNMVLVPIQLVTGGFLATA